jgi:hypothetical protein
MTASETVTVTETGSGIEIYPVNVTLTALFFQRMVAYILDLQQPFSS